MPKLIFCSQHCFTIRWYLGSKIRSFIFPSGKTVELNGKSINSLIITPLKNHATLYAQTFT
ncbi:hypothetical protein VVMO6_00700 [Vibrio vulnificus MO6-24/O]|nr:hypothetical protein VVMO6_00700 [Vibrio vulnificus MO6-24/O]